MISIFDHGTQPSCPDNFNLAEYVLRRADEIPDKTALVIVGLSESEYWSYADLKRAVLGTAAGFRSLGLKPGQRILLRLGNTVDFPLAYLGAIAAGLVPIPTSAQLTEPEVQRLMEMTVPDIVVAEKGIAVPRDLGIQILSATELRTFRDLPPIDFITGDPNRLAYILFTSGTSGIPRPVAHAHRAIWARQMMWKDWYDLNENDRLLHAGAFNWSFTLGTGLLDPWSVGATSIILGHDATFASLPKIMKQNQATLFAAAPGVYRQMLSNTQELDLPDLRHGLCAGEKLSAGIHESWTASTGLGLHEAFGMTECSTFISASPGKAASESLGMPQRGRRVAIVSEKGPVAQGEIGQIAISKSDAGLMLGYLDAPEETLRRYQGEWFLTGDLGSIAADGGISYHGRQDDMMNAGGFRVSPIEVEKTLQLHPKINEVAVTDIEIKTDTQVIAAFYTSDEDIASEDLQSYVENKLARYKQPRIYQRLDSLPRGVNNKLLRKKLKLETDQ